MQVVKLSLFTYNITVLLANTGTEGKSTINNERIQ